MNPDSTITGVAIVGCGNVGGATAKILSQDSDILAERLCTQLRLKYIVDVDFTYAGSLSLDKSLFCDDLETALADDSVLIVAELIGGIDTARDVISRSLRAGKHVVTANKALLAQHGPELFAVARENGVSIAFEASCAGGIPIVRALLDGLVSNRLDALFGIVNGTCNFVLTEMARRGITYAEALAEAQQQGLAEADPTLDVSGMDSAHKLAVLASLAFGRKIEFMKIPINGIDNLQQCDVAFGESLGYVIKLLAIAERQDEGIALRTRPAFISREHPLAWVSGPFNAISVYGNVCGHTMYYGRGAGGMPSASAVISDMCSIAMGNWLQLFNSLPAWPDRAENAQQLPIEAVRSRYYLRVMCDDRPGVLGKITTILGRRNISITSVLQHEPAEDSMEGVPVIITTHRAVEGDVRNAIEEINSMDEVNSETVCIGIVEEYPEDIK